MAQQEVGCKSGQAGTLVQQTMFAQELCFQAQLRELHRLASRQRELTATDTQLRLAGGRFGLKVSHPREGQGGALESSSEVDSEHCSHLLRLSSTSSHPNREHVSRPFPCHWRPPSTHAYHPAPADTSSRLLQIHPHPAGDAPGPLYHSRAGWGGSGGVYLCPSPAWGAPRAPFKQPPPLVLLRGGAGEEMRLIPAEQYAREKQGETSASSSLGESGEARGGGQGEEAGERGGHRDNSSGDVVDPGDQALPGSGPKGDGGLELSQRAAQVLMSFSPRKGVKRRVACEQEEGTRCTEQM